MLVSHFTLRFKELKIEMVYLLVQTNKIIYVLLIVYLYNFYTNKKTKKIELMGKYIIFFLVSCYPKNIFVVLRPLSHIMKISSWMLLV